MQQRDNIVNGLHHPSFERGDCGFGLLANLKNRKSHWLVRTAIEALGNLSHRGAISSDGKSGDGCGILLKLPRPFFEAIAEENAIVLKRGFAVGMLFLSENEKKRQQAMHTMDQILTEHGLHLSGWRKVPLQTKACGVKARASLPYIAQCFVNRPREMDNNTFDKTLFITRKKIEGKLQRDSDFFICSLSAKIIVYKGLIMPVNLASFFPDLADTRMQSSLCIFHQRFSTNTLPRWALAQPFRYLAHNGEINTIRGNRNWVRARSAKITIGDLDLKNALSIVSDKDSDSCSLDNMLEVLLQGGIDVFRAIRMLMPPAWQSIPAMHPEKRAFYAFNGMKMEPWDGPACMVMSDGRYGVCALDRNGLRPARYVITRDDHVILGSEVGLFQYEPEDVVSKGRLGPGQILAIDTKNGVLINSEKIDTHLAEKHPYRKWIKNNLKRIEAPMEKQPLLESDLMEPEKLLAFKKLFLLSYEEEQQMLHCLADTGKEPISAMGDDTPISVLSNKERSLYDSFRQMFAQVTNPPIDPLREKLVMSLATYIGKEGDLLYDKPSDAKRLLLSSPVLSERKFKLILDQNKEFQHHTIDLYYKSADGLRKAIDNICHQAEKAVEQGAVILILSDSNVTSERYPVHALLATGAVHHHLITKGLRCDVSLIVKTATARDPHQFATLIGYGATAIYPYLAYAAILELKNRNFFTQKTDHLLAKSYRSAINTGLYKILSKMGISTIASYRASQLFEIVGLDKEVVEKCFKGSVSRIGGGRFDDIEKSIVQRARYAWDDSKPIKNMGLYKYTHGEEEHAFNPDVVKELHAAVISNKKAHYDKYSALIQTRKPLALRDLFVLKQASTPTPMDQVEPIEAITKRFDTAAMSIGALSPTAHSTLAMAMNTLGGRSNSGEGGEDPKRYNTQFNSKIKQVASGRFGVTPEYLINAEVIQIKIAQGAKPGEGGQLPAKKVNDLIAKLRFAVPGIALISPPPHHDIYSIEDLAQLIFDLKQVNPSALISVKLVSAPGVGTIAAGVVKAYADLITIAGHDGGTGASPLTSVRHTGSPWELGLSETHQMLCTLSLRDRVILQVDGGLKNGIDVIKGAILGAESFGFGTVPMIAMGCKYLRLCHLNNCPTGIATQNEVLYTSHFAPKASERVMNYFRFLAEEVREIMSTLGIAKLEDLIGRYDLLNIISKENFPQKSLLLDPIINDSHTSKDLQKHSNGQKNMPHDRGEFAETVLKAALPYIEDATKPRKKLKFVIKNYHRSIGARISGEIAKRYGNAGITDNPIVVHFKGSAGQSFGAWNANGLEMHLEGDANDYVGKGMHGGKLNLFPPAQSLFESNNAVIMGNTCLYGATGGQCFAAGKAGERFAVRNSGAMAVVEGIGDHGCEYMTGGIVVILGEAGINFGAGMTGGLAFVLDLETRFYDKFNNELIDIYRIFDTECNETYSEFLAGLIKQHIKATNSSWAKEIEEDFLSFLNNFWLVKPKASDLNLLLDNLFAAA